MAVTFSELGSAGLIAARGVDAAGFLHAQLTSDIAGLPAFQAQYSGYCSPKGRLLATFLVWRAEDEFLLQLPEALCASVLSRLAKYVLRAQVRLSEASSEYRLFGVAGSDAQSAVEALAGTAPLRMHEIVSSRGYRVTRLSASRFVVLAAAQDAAAARAALAARAEAKSESAWARLDIEAGIPAITPATQDEYVPQMVNLDLIGAVSYTKGCYPGQEIVARTHYLGRLKQRMYRIHAPTVTEPLPGDALYSPAFGENQASGAVLAAAPAEGTGYDALAVIQTSAVANGSITWKSPEGPAVELKPLPYSIPE
jgi:folate-binding protein YgfZ